MPREIDLAHLGLSTVDDEQKKPTGLLRSEKVVESLGKLRLTCKEREVIGNGNARADQLCNLPPFGPFGRVGASAVVAQKIENGSGSPSVDHVASRSARNHLLEQRVQAEVLLLVAEV